MNLSKRRGLRPRTTSSAPHSQIDQQPEDRTVREELAARAFAISGVREEPSGISVPGARALVVERDHAQPSAAFMVGHEFAHLHPEPDWSLHLTLPDDVAQDAISAGWAELHYLAVAGEPPSNIVMVYAPRDHDELEVVWHLVRESHRFATGPPAEA